MRARTNYGAEAPRTAASGNNEGPTVATVAPQESKQDENADFGGATHASQALRAIEGERKAGEFLARLYDQQTSPDELALIVAALYGATLRGFCRAIVKAIGVADA